MPETVYRGRRAVFVENDQVRVTMLPEGGHIAEIAERKSGVNPLWTPPWPTIEPSVYDSRKHPEYGADSESRLLAGIHGHNICLDIFGPPTEEEAVAGLTVHGEAPVARYSFEESPGRIRMQTSLPGAQLRLTRTLTLRPENPVLEFVDVVENLSISDRPIAWTEHVTLGPPFLKKGVTEFRSNAAKSMVAHPDFSNGLGYMKAGAEFNWPYVPRQDAGTEDLRVFTTAPVSAGFTAHLIDQSCEHGFFTAFNSEMGLAIGYLWQRSDFPWLSIWEENHSLQLPPWNGRTLTRGMEFGMSPFAETRRQMIERRDLFGVPSYGWLPARSRRQALFFALVARADRVPEMIEVENDGVVRFSF
jgi:hypothetical protein